MGSAWFSETDPPNAFDLTLGEGGEEEDMEVDELIPPTSALQPADLHGPGGDGAHHPGEVHGADDANRGGSGEDGGVRSESHTREYMSLRGSPHSQNEPGPLYL